MQFRVAGVRVDDAVMEAGCFKDEYVFDRTIVFNLLLVSTYGRFECRRVQGVSGSDVSGAGVWGFLQSFSE